MRIGRSDRCEVKNSAGIEWISCCVTKESSKSDGEAKTESTNSGVANDESSKIDGANVSAEPFPLGEAKLSNTVTYTCPLAFSQLRNDLLTMELRTIGNLRC